MMNLTDIGLYPIIAIMWIKRDILKSLKDDKPHSLPVKVLRGPRQVGKTTLLDHLQTHKLVLFDDLGIRNLAQTNPALFFEQFTGPLILDEATFSFNSRINDLLQLKLKPPLQTLRQSKSIY